MDLTDLLIFRTVVDAGGITRAAERLHRVQSNITTRVRQLEDDLGVKLFIREGKRLHLSPAGQNLLGYADRLLALAQEAREGVQDSVPRGPFRLGTMESTAAVRLPEPLSLYHRRYPEVELELRTGNPQQLAARILNGEIDAALAAEPIADAPFEKVPIYDEELAIIAAADQPPITSVQSLKRRTLLTFEPGCPYRKRLEDWFADQGEQPGRIVEMSSYHTMLGCAVAGMGISLLPRGVLATFPDRERLSVHRLPPGQDIAHTVLIWRKGAGSAKIDALVQLLTAKPAAKPVRARSRRKSAIG
ncbi:MAG: LysR family transcriptional regulator [Alphaproteobacteria bacterium]|nr:LysR family transcriptional regulator [Alphaproteobacteria bacterium]